MSAVPGPGLLAVGWRCELWPTGATVLRGVQPEPLTEREHRVWAATLGAPGHPADRPWTAEDVARTADLPDGETDTLLAQLAGRGLVAGVDLADPGPAARGLTLLPLAEGWGNTADDPDTFRVGLAGTELATLPRHLHDALSLAGCWPDLEAAAGGLAELTGGPDPVHVLRELIGVLPVLCSLGAAALQPAGAP